jgi:D-glycero-D-manno-heptose 1,7-bisphosphate phosphatase
MPASRKALFLDRDGVINIDHGYVCTPDRTDFVDGIFALCTRALALGYRLIIATNQAGIARGYFSESDFDRYMDWMRGVFREQGIEFTAVYHCPHHASEGLGAYRITCACRKPAPGMLLQAMREHALDAPACALIGDKQSDIEAGRTAGVGCLIRLDTSTGTTARAMAPEVRAVASLHEAQPVLEQCSREQILRPSASG